MTEKAELDRVRAIHAALDRNFAEGANGFTLGVGYERMLYTAEEVRAWPEMKAHMRRRLLQCGPDMIAYARPSDLDGCWLSMGASDDAAPYIARGLCLYREMLDDAKPEAKVVAVANPTTPGTWFDELRRAREWRTEILGEWAEPENRVFKGIPTGHAIREPVRLNEEQIAALTVALPANVEARKRNVDRLRREMDEGESRRAALVGLVHPVTNRALGRMR